MRYELLGNAPFIFGSFSRFSNMWMILLNFNGVLSEIGGDAAKDALTSCRAIRVL